MFWSKGVQDVSDSPCADLADMNQRMWSGRTLLKYVFLQLLGIAAFVILLMLVRQWIEIPLWLMLVVIGLWVVKDIILYPFVWRSYEWGSREENSSMIGLRGMARDRLDPSGYIFVRGELWKASVFEDSPAIEKDENVMVQGIRGLVLLVEPENEVHE